MFGVSARRIAPLFLLSIVILFQYLLFFKGRLPAHDTQFSFEIFNSLYTSLLFHHEIPLWLPHYNYGSPNIFFLLYVSPASFIVAAAGMLVGYEQVLNLFYASILLEECIFLIGVYFLARKLYTSLNVALFVTASSALTVFPLWQIYFDFKLYIWLPYLLYFAIRFSDKRDVNYLFVSGCILMLSMIGQAGYFLPVIGVYVGLFLIVHICANNKIEIKKLSIIVKPRALLALVAMLALFGLYVWLSYHQFENMAVEISGRNPDTLRVSRDVFLSYGFDPSLAKFYEFLYAVPASPDTRLYIGYIPLAFVLYALVFVGARKYVAFLAVAVFVMALACSQLTAVAPLTYAFVPGIDVFRHLGSILGVAKLMLIFVAGFGLQHFLARLEYKKLSMHWNQYKKNVFRIISVLILLAVVSLDMFFFGALPYVSREIPFVSAQQFHYLGFAVLGVLVFVISRKHSGTMRYMGVIIIVFHSFEMLSYQNYLYSLPQVFRPNVDSALFDAKPTTYQPVRSREIPGEVAGVDSIINEGTTYRIRDSWLNFDPCAPRGRSEFRTAAVDHLLHAINPDAEKEYMVWSSAEDFRKDAVLSTIVGCEVPKLRFVPSLDVKKASASADINNALQIFDRPVSIPFDENRHFIGGRSFSIFVNVTFSNAIRKYDVSEISLISQSEGGGAVPKWFLYLKKVSDTKVALAWHAWDASLTHPLDRTSEEIALDDASHQLGIVKKGAQYTFMVDGKAFGAFEFEPPLSIPKGKIVLGGANDRVKVLFPGVINEVAVYDAALLAEPAFDLFNKGGATEARLVGKRHLKGYWKNSDANVWEDMSGQEQDGIAEKVQISMTAPALTHEQTLLDAELFLRERRNTNDVVLRCADQSQAPCLFLAKPLKGVAAEQVTVHDMSNNHIRTSLNVSNPEGGWLIYADSWYKGWEAFVDGKETEILEANLGFKAVRLERGAHDVEFRFRSPVYANVVYGALMVLSSMMLIFALLYMMFRARSKCRPKLAFA